MLFRSWMSALLVSKNYRGKGIGTALIEAIEKEAQRLGAKTYIKKPYSLQIIAQAIRRELDR